ncbi:MAG: hypothetical protein E3K40_08315 [Candidatus Brocadia sp.]|nr:hypothetical protein [Candidatus Brocadia sp.]MDG6026695.1 hypothetical protein [Candidatus Brocadia sp.]
MKSLKRRECLIVFESVGKKIRQWKHYLPVINLFLFIGVVSLAILCVLLVYYPPETAVKPDKEGEGTPVKNSPFPSLKADLKPVDYYELILSNNPFSPNRTVWATTEAKTGAKTGAKTDPKPVEEGGVLPTENQQKPRGAPKKITLRGILILGDTKKALIENPDQTTNKKPFIFIEEGEEIAEYRVKIIEPDQVKLDWYGEEQVVVMRSNIKK